jgi:hypothetical protein
MIKRGVVDFAVGADWTPAAGDCKIAVDAAAPTNITNLPTAVASGNGAYWEFILTAAELSCKQAIITIVDAATKAVEDQSFLVETFGNASAMYQADLSAANLPANVVQWATVSVTGMPMPTYTQPTGFLAATFPSGTVANQTNITGGTITTVTNLTNAPTAGDFTATMKTSIGTAVAASAVASVTGNVGGSVGSVTGAVGSVTGNVGGSVASVVGNVGGSVASVVGNVGGSVASVTAPVTADMVKINGDTTAASNMQKAGSVMYQGSVTGAATVTSLIDAGLTQGAVDHWKGRIVIFTSGTLKFQGSNITAYDPATSKITFVQCTSAPSGGDTYIIL